MTYENGTLVVTQDRLWTLLGVVNRRFVMHLVVFENHTNMLDFNYKQEF